MILFRPHTLFDKLEGVVEGAAFRRLVSLFLVIAFLGTLALVELKRQEFLPAIVQAIIPGSSHLIAIDLSFGLLLIYEGIGLIIGLARSVSEAVGKQIEIFSLILLRRSFKEFAHFSEPLKWSEDAGTSVGHMLADAGGALVIFVLLAVYYRVQKHQSYLGDDKAQSEFIEYKKAIALLLLVGYLGVGVYDCFLWVSQKEDRLVPFFEVFYTMLIFVDILLVLISLQFSSTYHVAFRASGFAVATVFLRIALVGPPYINAALGVGATLYALGLTLAYRSFFTDAGPGAGQDHSHRATAQGTRGSNALPRQDQTPEALPSR
jgi:hypothetical protein